MKKKILLGGLVMVVSIVCCRAEVGIAPLQRGVNLSHWFSQTYLPTYPPKPVTAEDMQLIRSAGFDHIRLPVDPVRLQAPADESALDVALLEPIDAAIQLALDHGLNVVVDMHPHPSFKEKLQNDPVSFESFLIFWEQLARHFAQYDPRRVALEMLNEPLVEDPAQWQSMANRLHAAIRKGAPNHTIVVGGGEWSDVAAMCQLVPMADANTRYTFHFYAPHLFTHQGAGWGEPEWKLLTCIPYPLSPTVGSNLLAKASNPLAHEALAEHLSEGWNAEKIDREIGKAAAWAKEHGVSIGCGEFGVYRAFAAPQDRARYLHDVRISMERHGIAWTMWDYKGGFSLIEKETGSPKIDPLIGQALGLSSPKADEFNQPNE